MGSAGDRRRVRRGVLSSGRGAHAAQAASIVAALLIVAGVYLGTYAIHDVRTAVGSDTPQAVWRSNVVAQLGLDGLPAPGPNVIDAGVDRPGLPIVVAVVAGIGGVSPAEIAFGLPAAAAAALALAAGAFAIGVLRRPVWLMGVVVLLVGASANVDLFAAGYFDNLLAAVVLLGGFTLLLLPSTGGAGLAGGGLLLAGAAAFHWPIASFAALLLLATAVWTAAAGRDRATAVRLAAGVGIGAVAGWIVLALAPGRLLSPQLPDRTELLEKLNRLYPIVSVPIVVALAIAGLVLLRAADGPVPAGRRLLTVWALTGAASVVAIEVGVDLPAHRLVAFALAVPILAAVAVGGLIRAGARVRPAAALGLGILGASVVIGAVVLTATSWWDRPPAIPDARLPALQQLAGVVDATSAGTKVVVVVDAPRLPVHGATTAIRRIRALIDPSRVGDVHVFVGDPGDALAGRQTERPSEPAFTHDADLVWPSVRSVLPHDPVVIVSGLYFRSVAHVAATHPEADAVDGLVVFRGSIPKVSLAYRVGPRARVIAPETAAIFFAIVLFAGIGWAWFLTREAWLRAGLAPALGLGGLALAGIIADRLGVSVGSRAGAWGVTLVVGAAGWAAVAVTRLGRGSQARSVR